MTVKVKLATLVAALVFSFLGTVVGNQLSAKWILSDTQSASTAGGIVLPKCGPNYHPAHDGSGPIIVICEE